MSKMLDKSKKSKKSQDSKKPEPPKTSTSSIRDLLQELPDEDLAAIEKQMEEDED